MNAMEISRTALDVEWRRLEIIAQNIANASTTLDASGKPYRALRLLSGPRAAFSDIVNAQGNPDNALQGVAVYSVEPQNVPPRRVYEPAHPQADSEGFVTYPGFDHAAEMALMVKTSRAYEANVVALNAARQMYAKAMEIGRRSA
jgi:flagellar basal-body rod protein FlgC